MNNPMGGVFKGAPRSLETVRNEPTFDRQQTLHAVAREVEQYLDAKRTGRTDLTRIAHGLYNLRYGLMIQLAEELHTINSERSATSPEEIAKLLYQWSKAKVEDAQPLEVIEDAPSID